MKKWWFNSMFSNEELEHKYRLSKSMDSFCPIRYSSGSEDPVTNDMDKNVSSWSDSGSCNFSSVAHFFDIIDIIDILSFISDDTFLVRDSNNGDSYSIYFDIENRIFEIDNDSTFLNKLESSFSSYLNSSYMSSGSKSSNRYYYHYMYDTQSSWNNHINSCIGSYLRFEISIDSYIPGGTHNYSDSYVYSFICNESKRSDDSYSEHIDSYQEETGLTDAVQTGIGQLNGIPVAIGVMDFQFMGGSMGSVVGEKITRLIEYATNQSLPVIIVCASGGARMQEGSFSLMQMAKISSALYNYKFNKKLFYVSILTSPTTGGVTASFGMSGDIIIAEPNAYIAFAGKRVIEQTLNKTVPEGSQEAEYSFYTGLVDPIVPRNLLKGVLGELFQLHGFLPLT
uniref:acetyl-CoA carboxylase beta subunit n=1 Tax=Amorphophallus coaetaneus TaxID=175724 RepID=UPI0024116699|nr:acetyl-CoA carboxylase beta subunit [Amorphophallus coaetaneus]WEI30147.1 acetyl-CoA carboxylase beta subunit [Amorphophallus coaetaneus]